MLTEVRVDESAQPHSTDVQSDAEKGPDPGLAEAMRSWVHRLLDRNDTNVHLVRVAPHAVVPGRSSRENHEQAHKAQFFYLFTP